MCTCQSSRRSDAEPSGSWRRRTGGTGEENSGATGGLSLQGQFPTPRVVGKCLVLKGLHPREDMERSAELGGASDHAEDQGCPCRSTAPSDTWGGRMTAH